MEYVQMENIHAEILSVKAAAAILDMSPARYYQLFEVKQVPGYRRAHSHNIIITKAAMHNYLDEMTRLGTMGISYRTPQGPQGRKDNRS
jgi:hypothetical protein